MNAPTVPLTNGAEAAPDVLSLLIGLQQRCIRCEDLSELGFVIANETWHLVPYSQACVFFPDDFGALRLRAVTGLGSIQEDTPFGLWVARLCKLLATEVQSDCQPRRLAASMFSPSLGDAWAEWWPPFVVGVPLVHRNHYLGYIFLARESAWTDGELALLATAAETWAHCARLFQRRRLAWQARLQTWWRHPRRKLALLGLLCLSFIPVRTSVLAPAEVIALRSQVLAAPIEGVVQKFHVEPNSAVKAGTVVFSMDDTALRNRREVARESLAVARTDALSAQQKSFDSQQTKADLLSLRGKVQEREAELAGIEDALKRLEVTAPVDGVVVFGELRQSFLFLATTAWVISIGLNASPFMRFDGYFILSDLLDIPNLHERSSALARHAMRRSLLGWNDPIPEELPRRVRLGLIAFAYVTWIYRLIVFTGIAIAVYFMFFKLLGIFLFLVEIVWFVLRPIAQELQVWHKRKKEIGPHRQRIAALVACVLAGILMLPWDTSVHADGWLHSSEAHAIYSPAAAQLENIAANGEPMSSGSSLAILKQPELGIRQAIASRSLETLQLQLAGLGGAAGGEERRPMLEHLRSLRQTEVNAADMESNRLDLKSPAAGRLMDVDSELSPGAWVNPKHTLGFVVDPDRWVAEVFVSASQRERLQKGNHVRFYPQDNPLIALPGKVHGIDTARTYQLPHPLLASTHGGSIAVAADHSGGGQMLAPRDALYRVRIEIEGTPDWLAVRRGVAVIDASPHSWLWDAMKSMLLVFIREATF